MSKSEIDVSIIIVNYYTKIELFACIKSIILSAPKSSYEIVVVDNDEQKTIKEDLKKNYPKVIYVPNENKGFGEGSNKGATYAKGKYLFFLNPDTVLLNNTIDILLNYLKNKDNSSVVAPLLFDERKKPYPLQGIRKLTPLRAIFSLTFINKLFPRNKIAKEYWNIDWNKKETKEVDSVPGTAFMISKQLFKKIGGFDEKFFLFFEEFDLCRRVQEFGFKLYIIPQAKVMHIWGISTKNISNIDKIFEKSRLYYFKKNYGIILAICIESILRLRVKHLLIFGIVLFAAFLRFYRIEENMYFSGEIGDNLLTIKNAYLHGQLPLLGPPTSHPWLYFGPLFYWLYGPVLILSKFNPLSHAYFGAFVSVLIVIFNYIFIKKIFNERVALLSSFLISFSPLYLEFARNARFFIMVSLLVYPFFYLLHILKNNNKNLLFWIFLVYGLMFSFHFSPLMLFPLIFFTFFIRKVKLSRRDIFSSLAGFVIPMFPFFLYDVTHGLEMSSKIVLWIPYRIAGFFGLYPKNTVSSTALQENTVSVSAFFNKSFIPINYYNFEIIPAIISAIVIGVICFWLIKKKYDAEFLLIVWFILGLVAIFIHGSPPIHYFLPLLPVPILIFSLILNRIWNFKLGKYLVFIVLVMLLWINIGYYFSNKWFYNVYQEPEVSFALQDKIVKTIIKDANGMKFSMKRIGINDQFEGDYAQNYKYLLWLNGNEPVEKAHIRYTIIEDKKRISEIKERINKTFIINFVTITRSNL